jgi:hypothetical protein
MSLRSAKYLLKEVKSLFFQRINQRISLRIEVVHTWFLRSLALVWMLKGVVSWGLMLGIETSYQGVFEASSFFLQITVVFFAISHLVAAIGLWLLSNWGRAMWILTVLSETILSTLFPKILSAPLLILASNLFLMISYSVLIIYIDRSVVSKRPIELLSYFNRIR